MNLNKFESYDEFYIIKEEAEQIKLAEKAKDIASIVNNISSLQSKLEAEYSKLNSLLGSDVPSEVKNDIASMKKSSGDAKDMAKAIEDKVEKYSARAGSSGDMVLKYLSGKHEVSIDEMISVLAKLRKGAEGKKWNSATIKSTTKYLIKKGKVKKEEKENPRTKKIEWMYSLKKNAVNESAQVKYDWVEFEGDTLPKSAMDFVKGKNGFRYDNGWTDAYYEGDDPKTAKNWLVVTDDGGFYKVDAQYMIWHPDTVRARWSTKSMKTALKALLDNKPVPQDPDYQT